jgi:cation diffusion facilitator CzcD-associated flavoprotein CzcO
MKSMIRKAAIQQLPLGYDIDTHFTPRYQPWDQRLCFAPDGDLFAAIRHGRASVVTDHIREFTETGLRLESGAELEADIVITATGLRMLALGGIQLTVDGRDITLPETMAYKSMMLSGVPNFAFTIGYTNASWTLKADLVSGYVVRLLRYLDAHGYDQCVPTHPAATAGLPGRLCAALHRRVPKSRLTAPVATRHELRARRAGAAVRPNRRGRPAVSMPARPWIWPTFRDQR